MGSGLWVMAACSGGWPARVCNPGTLGRGSTTLHQASTSIDPFTTTDNASRLAKILERHPKYLLHHHKFCKPSHNSGGCLGAIGLGLPQTTRLLQPAFGATATPQEMCTQTYLKFAGCPCQLRFCFTECKYGPADPRCRYVKKEFVWAGSDFCHHHRWRLSQSSAWHAQQIQQQVYSRISSSSDSTDTSPRRFDVNGCSSPLA